MKASAAGAESESVNGTEQRVPNNDDVTRKRAVERWENEGGKVLADSTKSGNSALHESKNAEETAVHTVASL